MGQKLQKRIEIWKKLLLDYGKRNRLINFKESKRSTVKITSPLCAEFYEVLVTNEKEQQQFRNEVQQLVQLRRNSLPLIYGEYIPVEVTDSKWVFDRTYMGETVRVSIDLANLAYSIN